jgi:phosphoglycerate dehydrogenase-like enzyme
MRSIAKRQCIGIDSGATASDRHDATERGGTMTQDRTRLRIGFVGLGEIGAPIARRIADAGWTLTVYARRSPPLPPVR